MTAFAVAAAGLGSATSSPAVETPRHMPPHVPAVQYAWCARAIPLLPIRGVQRGPGRVGVCGSVVVVGWGGVGGGGQDIEEVWRSAEALTEAELEPPPPPPEESLRSLYQPPKQAPPPPPPPPL